MSSSLAWAVATVFATALGSACSRAPSGQTPAPVATRTEPCLLAVDTVSVALSDTTGMRDVLRRVQCDTAHPGPALRLWAGPDARDALDAGVDLLVTDDAAALEYAGSLPSLTTLPLEWRRTYVLVAPVPVRIDDTLKAALARHTVRVEARASDASHWWSDRDPDLIVEPAPRPPRRLAYRRGDPVARDLAERLVALGIFGRDASAVAVDDRFVLAEMAYVVGVCRQRLAGCVAPAVMYTVVPLIDTRPRIIAPRNRVVTPEPS